MPLNALGQRKGLRTQAMMNFANPLPQLVAISREDPLTLWNLAQPQLQTGKEFIRLKRDFLPVPERDSKETEASIEVTLWSLWNKATKALLIQDNCSQFGAVAEQVFHNSKQWQRSFRLSSLPLLSLTTEEFQIVFFATVVTHPIHSAKL